jgi:hypothetical protein
MIKRKPGDMIDLLPKEMTAKKIGEAVTQAHPDIAHLFGQGTGLHLMFIESEIIVRTLLSLKKEGVVALPVHDSVVVGRSHERRAHDAMHDASEAYTGMTPVIKSDRQG